MHLSGRWTSQLVSPHSSRDSSLRPKVKEIVTKAYQDILGDEELCAIVALGKTAIDSAYENLSYLVDEALRKESIFMVLPQKFRAAVLG